VLTALMLAQDQLRLSLLDGSMPAEKVAM